jgi:hypothetical protein
MGFAQELRENARDIHDKFPIGIHVLGDGLDRQGLANLTSESAEADACLRKY